MLYGHFLDGFAGRRDLFLWERKQSYDVRYWDMVFRFVSLLCRLHLGEERSAYCAVVAHVTTVTARDCFGSRVLGCFTCRKFPQTFIDNLAGLKLNK